MPFYAFRLNSIFVNNPRGKVPDDDIVTFQVVVNNVVRGQGSILLTDLAAGALIPLVPPPSSTYTFTPFAPNPDTATNINVDWIIGPMRIAPTDGVTISYSGTNISDNYSGPSQKDQDDLEIRILNAFYGALWGQVTEGPWGAALGSVLTQGSEILGKIWDVLGVLKDPVGELLNAQEQGPCNGAVFASATQLTGSEIAKLTFAPHSDYASLVDALEFPIVVHLDDSANHSANCGGVAHTDVSFSVLQISEVSVRQYIGRNNQLLNPENGIRQYATVGKAVDLYNLLQLTP